MITFGKIATPEVMEIVSIIDRVRETSSTLAKQAILKGNKDNEGLKELLELTYNPHKKFKMTNKTLLNEKHNQIGDSSCYMSLTTLANDLAENNTNDYYKQECCAFLRETDESIRDLYKGVLLKDLKIGVNTTTINKIWDGLIPTGETGIEIKPMLANKFDFEKPVRTDFVVTEKLDGIRCLAICKEENIELYTRQGKLIEGCVEIEESLRKIRNFIESDFVLDGELLADGCDYSTVYKETTKRVKNKDAVKTGIHYTVFDMIEYNEFCEQKCTMPYYERLDVLYDIAKEFRNGFGTWTLPNIEIIQALYMGSDINRLIELLDEYRNKGAEGLMINYVDGVYEFKRSKNIQKVKVMQTADLKIIGFEEGQGRNEGRLGALLVDFKGSTVGVGTGFSDFDREYIWNNQHLYLNRIVEVSYFEISKNKDGKESLRFPVFKEIRELGKEVSYY